MSGKAYVAGVGMVPFQKPGKSESCDLMAATATRLTEGGADGDNRIKIEHKEIRLGANPELLSQMKRMIPLGRVGTPEEAAGAVYLFCCPESNFISGQYVICGGGFTI